jgi:hypothetical protein
VIPKKATGSGALLLALSLGAATPVIGGDDQPNSPTARSAAAGEHDATDFAAAAARHGGRSTDPDHAGIWKAATPRDGTMHGEFGNQDPIGLSTGVKIKADCSINWLDPDSGKLYCFSSATSLVVFLDAPHAYLSLAARKWDDLNKLESR